MLKKIEEREIMTAWEAMNKYRDKYFHFVVTEEADNYQFQQDLGYVAYTYDCPREMRKIPKEEFKDVRYGALLGVAAEPTGLFAGIERIISYDVN